jgi:hypothetical protein
MKAAEKPWKRFGYCRAWLALGCAGMVLLATGCSEDTSSPDVPDDGPFVVGDTSSVVLDLPLGATYADSVTGFTFIFPSGASGRLTRGDLLEAPERPWGGGQGIYLAYDGSEPVQVRLPQVEGGCELALCYGMPSGSWASGIHTRWFALPVADTLRTSAGDSLLVWLGVPAPSASASCQGGIGHWFFSFAPGSAIADTLQAAAATAHELLATWLDSLDASTRLACRERIEGDLPPTFYPDGIYYCGFARPCAADGAAVARIGIGTAPTRALIARQLGYYFVHLLMGDDAYARVEDNAPYDPGFGLPQSGRTGLINDYGYLHEHLLTGAIEGAGNPNDPAGYFLPTMPAPSSAAVDVPALEGYGVLLMHALMRSDSNMVNLAGDPVKVVPVRWSYAQLAAQVLAGGASTMNELRLVIAERLREQGMEDRLAPLAAATGWAYASNTVVRDTTATAVGGVPVVNYVLVDGREYQSSSTPFVSEASGLVTLRGLFPGESSLRVAMPDDTFDVHTDFAWSRATSYAGGPSGLVPWRALDALGKIRIEATLTFAPGGVDTLAQLEIKSGLLLTSAAATFETDRIYTTGSYAYGCDPQGGKPCWVVDSLSVHYSLETGEVDELGFNIYDVRTAIPARIRVRSLSSTYATMVGCNTVIFVESANADSQTLMTQFAISATDTLGVSYTAADLVGTKNRIKLSAYRG